jgi:hypothetical protein
VNGKISRIEREKEPIYQRRLARRLPPFEYDDHGDVGLDRPPLQRNQARLEIGHNRLELGLFQFLGEVYFVEHEALPGTNLKGRIPAVAMKHANPDSTRIPPGIQPISSGAVQSFAPHALQ